MPYLDDDDLDVLGEYLDEDEDDGVGEAQPISRLIRHRPGIRPQHSHYMPRPTSQRPPSRGAVSNAFNRVGRHTTVLQTRLMKEEVQIRRQKAQIEALQMATLGQSIAPFIASNKIEIKESDNTAIPVGTKLTVKQQFTTSNLLPAAVGPGIAYLLGSPQAKGLLGSNSSVLWIAAIAAVFLLAQKDS